MPGPDGESMSAGTAGPETLGSLSDEPRDPGSQQPEGQGDLRQVPDADRARSTRSRQGRRRLCARSCCSSSSARSSPVRSHACSASPSRPPLASQRVDGLNNGLPKPEKGPPNGPFTWDHPIGVAPRTGEDNLAYWLYGCRISLLIATIATVIASTVGIVDRPARRLPRWHRRQGPVVLHRHVPHHPVPAGRADAGPDPQRAVQHLRQLRDDPEGQSRGASSRSSAGWAPPD